MGYLVCDKCGGYYELQPGESPDDFTDECECGGKTRYVENLGGLNNGMEKMGATIICPVCGVENPEGATICKSCKKMIKQKAPISTPRSENPKEGILETWNRQSTPLKALSILGVCCMGIILIVGVMAMVTPTKPQPDLILPHPPHKQIANQPILLHQILQGPFKFK